MKGWNSSRIDHDLEPYRRAAWTDALFPNHINYITFTAPLSLAPRTAFFSLGGGTETSAIIRCHNKVDYQTQDENDNQ